jgi:uncharacterized protein YgbK (DUF1537 family)
VLTDEIRRIAAGRIAVVVDDDATGSQAVRDVEVVTLAGAGDLVAPLQDAEAGFFLLTNSRALPAGAAARLAFDLGRRLRDAVQSSDRAISLISRSDSTLRGHFPIEVDQLTEGFGMEAPRILLAPFYGEGGRFTRDDVHLLRRDGTETPVAETEFAADPVFGYRSSNLLDWVREKAPGRRVGSVSLVDLRESRGAAVSQALAASPPGGVTVINATEERDIELAALGTLRAELDGIEVIARTAASYARARLGQPMHPILDPFPALRLPGLVVVGSHVSTSTAQLERLLDDPPFPIEPIELDVDRLVSASATSHSAIATLSQRLDAAVRRDITPVVFTTRQLRRGASREADLEIAAAVSSALVEIVRAVRARPAWIVAKGGITSTDLAVRALDVQSATVIGQLAPGVSLWRCGPTSRFPGLPYIVFPGNVGGANTLRAMCAALGRDLRSAQWTSSVSSSRRGPATTSS